MITTILGTNRPNSNTRRVGDELQQIYMRLGCQANLIDLIDLPQEIFQPTAYAEKPAAFAGFSRKVLDSSGLVIIVPEYNGSFPGILKLFIDHLPFPQSFEKKPVCFVGLSAGMWGALRAVEQLQSVFGYRNAHLYPERVFIPRCSGVFNIDGGINDAELVGRLERQASGFLKFVETLSHDGTTSE